MINKLSFSDETELSISYSLISTPYFSPKYFIASMYVILSTSLKNSIASPPFPVLKHLNICFDGDTKKEGVFSEVKGLNAL